MDDDLANLFFEPGALARLGGDTFLKMPLWRAKTRYRPVYIHTGLFSRFFPKLAASPWEDKANAIADTFSVTLDENASSGVQAGWAYADYQADPLHVSLAGNQGSGRAYYCGMHFNIKGEKTPLAASERPRFSDGNLEMERAIWEAYASNTLWEDIAIDVSPVLAVLDIGETCNVEWRSEPVRRAKIIRIDSDGTLDRVTHVFFRKAPLGETALLHTAQRFGVHAGEKILERITHGAWSPGNISLTGNLLDFDTVCAVKGRAPLHSSSRWHIENYFGFEHRGQLAILHALISDTAINHEQAGMETIEKRFSLSMQAHLREGFIRLMGFAGAEDLAEKFRADITTLLDMFTRLCMRLYPKAHLLHAVSGQSSLIHAADFSTFLRYYPLLHASQADIVNEGLSLMLDGEWLADPFTPTAPDNVPEESRAYYEEHIGAALSPYLLRTPDELAAFRAELTIFIEHYDVLFTHLLKHTNEPLAHVQARAYTLNEDRFYMLPAFTPSYLLSQRPGGMTDRQIHTYIEAFIVAGKRKPANLCDVRVYKEGFFGVSIYTNGTHQLIFRFFDGFAPPGDLRTEDFVFQVNGQELPLELIQDEVLELRSKNRNNTELLAGASREKPLTFNDILILYRNNPLVLTDFLQL